MSDKCLEFAKEALRAELKAEIAKRTEQLGETDRFLPNVIIRDITDEFLAQKRRQKYKELRALNILNSVVERAEAVDATTLAHKRQSPLLTLYRPLSKDRSYLTPEVLHDIYREEFLAQIPALAKYRPKLFRWGSGLNMTADQQRGIYDATLGIGEVKPEAKELADQLMRLYDTINDRANYVGLDVPKTKSKWNGPFRYKLSKVNEVAPDKWADEVLGAIPEGHTGVGTPILDRQLTVNTVTGKPMAEAELRDTLAFAHDSITSQGTNKLDILKMNRGKGWSKQYAHERVLHYTPEGQKFMREKYGHGTDRYVEEMLSYIDEMGEKIAITELLGPNPVRTHEIAKNIAIKKLGKKAAQPIVNELDAFQAKLIGHPVTIENPVARAIETAFRAGVMSKQLAGAYLPSLMDTANVVRQSIYMHSSITAPMKHFLTAMRNKESFQIDMLRLGLQGEQYFTDMARARFDPDLAGSAAEGKLGQFAEWANNKLNLVLEKSVLTPHTTAIRSGWRRHIRFDLADKANTKWQALNPDDRGFYEMYGITQKQWDEVMPKALGDVEFNGIRSKELDIWKLKELDEDLYRRIKAFEIDSGKMAVLTSSIRTEKALDTLSTPFFRNNIIGSWMKMYKRFPMGQAIATLDLLRNNKVSFGRRAAAYGANVGLNMSLAVLVIQGRQLLAGKDFKPMDNASFWAETMLYAGLGGFGIGVDTALGFAGITSPTDVDRFDPRKALNWVNTLPPAREIGNVGKETWNAISKAIEDESFDPLLGLGVTAAKNAAAPFGGNLWWHRPMSERVANALQMWADPDGYEERMDRREDWMDKEGQGYWWDPAGLPSRPPQMQDHPEGGLGEFQKYVD